MKKEASVEEVVAAALPATPENRYKALLALEGREYPIENDGPLLLTMGEACELIPCSRSTLWRIIQAGRLEKVELFPGSNRLRRADVLALAGVKGGSND